MAGQRLPHGPQDYAAALGEEVYFTDTPRSVGLLEFVGSPGDTMTGSPSLTVS